MADELDRFDAVHGAAYQQALGGEAGQKRLAELQSASIISTETNHFAFSPAMSYPSPETVAADPAFWTPKPAPAAKPAATPDAKAPEKK